MCSRRDGKLDQRPELGLWKLESGWEKEKTRDCERSGGRRIGRSYVGNWDGRQRNWSLWAARELRGGDAGRRAAAAGWPAGPGSSLRRPHPGCGGVAGQRAQTLPTAAARPVVGRRSCKISRPWSNLDTARISRVEAAGAVPAIAVSSISTSARHIFAGAAGRRRALAVMGQCLTLHTAAKIRCIRSRGRVSTALTDKVLVLVPFNTRRGAVLAGLAVRRRGALAC
ncbi:hypothetical protein QBC47DRAFT_2049 [Echria macrotheca]|uniref:Uncharacterized protein n=1 Tax=Echria macrotheca TaxID=438768 RepID=A0AAJ0BKZ2_9PEZI|nr:hypothetical protein QBC47DRAFT_2049 [Echria macrotheca]